MAAPFWIFGHPEVYIVFLPSIALVAMIVPTFARTQIVGYGWVVLAAVGTGFLSFGLWVHHMFTTGLPGISIGIFSAASQAVAIPTGVQLFCFIATLAAGRVVRSVPMLFVLGGMAIFVLGGLTGVMVAIAPFDFQAHDTFFIVGHLHYVLVGGTISRSSRGFTIFSRSLTARRSPKSWGGPPSGSCLQASMSPSCPCTSRGCLECRGEFLLIRLAWALTG